MTKDCRCICVKKKKKKSKKIPKPQKQEPLVNRYNNPIPIYLQGKQTTFREPLPARKYSVFKPKTLQVEKVRSSKILTPIMKPPAPQSRIESTRLRRESAERRLEQTIMEIDTQTRPRPSGGERLYRPGRALSQQYMEERTTPPSTQRPLDRRRPQPNEVRPFQRVSGRPGRQIASTISRSVFADTGAGAGAGASLD